MNSLSSFFLLAVICTTLASPTDLETHSLARQRRDISLDIFGNTKHLVEDLVANLRKAAQQARDAVSTFASGIKEQALQAEKKIQEDLEKLKERVTQAIQTVTNKFSSSGSAVKDCVQSHREEADVLIDDSMKKTRNCVDGRLTEASEMISGLSVIAENAHEYTSAAFAEMNNCTSANSGHILATGSCLGKLAMQTEMKGAIFLTQSGLSIARINLFMATLPTYLEMCAGSGLVGAGIGTAKIVMEIGSCSASSFFSTFTDSSGSGSTDSTF